MRSFGVSAYFSRRYGKTVGVYLLGLLVFMLIALLIMMQYTSHRVVQVGLGGEVAVTEGNSEMTLYVDPSVVVGAGSYSFVIAVLTFLIIGRERQFFVSMATTRYEILIGSFVFLVGMSAALSLVGGWLLPTVVRLVLFLLGFATQGGWNAGIVLTGGDPQWWRTLIISFLDMVEMAGWVMLLGYLIKRWWKAMLIIGAAGIVTVILVATQLSAVRYVQILAKWAMDAIEWLVTNLLPSIQDYFANTNLAFIALRKIAAGSVLTALCYPVMRWMKVG